MYDRRPASRAARGTPNVAVFTPVVRGSFHSAISSPLARAKGPSLTADISWMLGGTSSETGAMGLPPRQGEPMADAPSTQPVAPAERILGLDVLRGFAMFGVLLAYCMWSLGTAPDERWTALDRRLAEFVNFAVDGKFYTILAFLFGLGFSIQLSRAASDGAAVETYCQRLGVLAGIGLAHALLLRNGDIL